MGRFYLGDGGCAEWVGGGSCHVQSRLWQRQFPSPDPPQFPEAGCQHLPRGKGDYGYVLVVCYSSVGSTSSLQGLPRLRQMMVMFC